MKWLRLFLLPTIIAVGVLMNSSPADAQKGGGGGRGGAGHAPSGAGRPSVGVYRGGYGYGYGGIGYGYPYSSFGYGYPLGYGGIGSPYYGSSYYNSYYPPITYAPPLTIIPAGPAINNGAQIEVRLPVADASVTLNGNPTSSTGAQRLFNTPALEAGYAYSYQIAATWMQGGETVRVERTIQVAPGRTTLVDFTRTDTEPRTPPMEP